LTKYYKRFTKLFKDITLCLNNDDGLVIKKLVSFIQSRETLLGPGLTKVVLSIKELQATKEFIILIHETVLRLKIPLDMKLNRIIYTRVSSSKQKNDLDRQTAFLQNKYPNHIVIKDIGSGLNYKRKGLLKLLELSFKGLVGEVVVYSKDRLCRFGFELVEWLLLQNDSKILVLEQIDKSPEQEFSEDILSILQVFACRWNGKRKYTDKNKEIQVEIKQLTDT
jgi:predicted site-specific integrase-resolvase